MVHYDILTIHRSKSVALVLVHMTIATTETQKAKNNIVRIYREGVISNTNAITGGCLSGNCYITFLQLQSTLQEYRTADIKHDGSDSTLVASPSEGAFRSVII